MPVSGLTCTLPPWHLHAAVWQAFQTRSASTCSSIPTFGSVQFSRSTVSDSLRPHDSHINCWQLNLLIHSGRQLKVCLVFCHIPHPTSGEIQLSLTLNCNRNPTLSCHPFYCQTGWAIISLCYCNCLPTGLFASYTYWPPSISNTVW